MTTYWFTPRPQKVEHQHPYLVFDSQDRLHLPLMLVDNREMAHPHNK